MSAIAAHADAPGNLAAFRPDPRAAPLAGRYRLDEVIGRGGWATVYRARDLVDGTDVAVKVLSSTLRANAEHVRLFLAEASTLAQLHHPHVVTVRDYGQADSTVYVALELLEGRSLTDEIDRWAPLAPGRAARIAVQICEGLGAAHDRGIVHRDLKPDNILLVRGEDEVFVKVADFGIARSLVDGADLEIGGFAGTPQYTSPEQARGEEADARSDLYALGLVLYEMLGGEPAFPSEHAIATLQRRITASPPRLQRVFPDLLLPDGLEEVVTRLLAVSPADRPRNAAEARARLARFADGADPPRGAEQVEAGDVTAVYAPLDLSPPLRARDAEIRSLLPFVERLDDHPTATALVIVGAAGVGKSRLAAHLAEVACSRHGARRFDRECSDSGTPLRELAGVIEELLGTSGLDAGVLHRRLGGLLGDAASAEELTRVLRPEPAPAPVHERDAEPHRDYQCQVVLDALASLSAQRPLVIVLEDAHWADALTRGVVARLPLWSRDRGKGLLVLVTWTTGAGPEPPATLARERFGDRVRLVGLEPLSAAGADELLRAVGPLDVEARALIAGLGAGNPLHLVQLVRHFRDEKLLMPSRRGWRLAPRARFNLSVPPALGDLHARHVEQLRARDAEGALAADLVERMALLGERTSRPALCAMIEREGRPDLLRRMVPLVDLLVSEGLVHRANGDAVVFSHALAREAIAAVASGRPNAALVHLAIADAMLAVHGERDPLATRAAAIHLLRGNQPERALPLALRSAMLSRSLGDAARAAEDYLLALRAIEAGGRIDPSGRLEIELGLGEALLMRGETRQAEDHFQQALEISDGAAAHEGLGRVAELRGDYAAARDRLQRAEQLHLAEGRVRQAAESAIALGRTLHKLRDMDAAKQRFEQARSVFDDLGDAVGAARAKMWLGGLGAWTGDYAQGLSLLERALPVFEATGNPLLIGECLSHMGSISSEMGRYEAAVDLNRRAQACFERAGLLRGVVNALGAIGTARGFLGAYDEARRLLEASLRLAEDIEHDAQISYCLVNLGWLCRIAGRLEESVQWLRSALVHLHRQGQPVELSYALVELGLSHFERGALDEAEAEFKKALATPALRPDLRAECLRRLQMIARSRRRSGRSPGMSAGPKAAKRERLVPRATRRRPSTRRRTPQGG